MGNQIILKESFMKKKLFVIMALLALSGVLFVTSCKDDDEDHTDPAFLVGTWTRTDNEITFTIAADLSFECTLEMPANAGKAKVKGDLDAEAPKLGANDYMIRNMETMGDDTIYPGNEHLGPQLGGFQNLLATLKPNSDKTSFVFSSGNPQAKIFFGGTYNK